MATAAQADWLSPVDDGEGRVAAAVQDFRPAVIQIRALSARLFPLAEGSPHRQPLQEQIDDLIGGMQARADATGITLDEMFRLINQDLASRRDGNDQRPHGEHLRAMADENTAAYADEERLHREITRLQGLLPAATARRIAADRNCAGFLAGWAIRGRTFS